MHPLVQTWLISQQMNELLIKNIPEEALKDVSAGKGRNVGQQIAHIHNVRLMWVKAAEASLMKGLDKIEKEDTLTPILFIETLRKSARVMSELIEKGIQAGRIKGFKPHPEAFVGYLIAHEAHHRGQIILTLKENGHLPDKKTLFGLWEWGREVKE